MNFHVPPLMPTRLSRAIPIPLLLQLYCSNIGGLLLQLRQAAQTRAIVDFGVRYRA